MSIDRKRRTAVKISKEKVKKIGIRSISDIIHNTKELNFKELQAKYEESVKELEELKNGYKK